MYSEDTLISNIRKIINNKGIKQKSVAEKAGIPPALFYSITSGRKRVPAMAIPDIAKALDVTPNELFGIGNQAS